MRRKGVGSDHSSLYVVKCIFFFLVNEGLWFFFVCLGIFFYFLCCFKGNAIHGQTKRGSPHQLDPFVRIMNTLPKSERRFNPIILVAMISFRLHAFDPPIHAAKWRSRTVHVTLVASGFASLELDPTHLQSL